MLPIEAIHYVIEDNESDLLVKRLCHRQEERNAQ